MSDILIKNAKIINEGKIFKSDNKPDKKIINIIIVKYL